MEEARRRHPIPRKAIYLVGHGQGAARATFAGNRVPSAWRGIGTLGGGLPPHQFQAAGADAAPFRQDVWACRGEADTDPAKALAEALSAAGHDVTWRLVAGGDAACYQIGPALAADFWTAMQP